jgi:hypothetical protein
VNVDVGVRGERTAGDVGEQRRLAGTGIAEDQ